MHSVQNTLLNKLNQTKYNSLIIYLVDCENLQLHSEYIRISDQIKKSKKNSATNEVRLV